MYRRTDFGDGGFGVTGNPKPLNPKRYPPQHHDGRSF